MKKKKEKVEEVEEVGLNAVVWLDRNKRRCKLVSVPFLRYLSTYERLEEREREKEKQKERETKDEERRKKVEEVGLKCSRLIGSK
jgi:hypothetical protein